MQCTRKYPDHIPQKSAAWYCAIAREKPLKKSLLTLCEQNYAGVIEIISVIDGAIQNEKTLKAAQNFSREYTSKYLNRILRILPKWQRGGQVSSLNSGLSISNGKIIMALDGDTSFNNDTAQQKLLSTLWILLYALYRAPLKLEIRKSLSC
jgi:cellulose synthase/poly-beta-1,6-N-acetylglucosamine synthase-like glycosyltransferase